MKIYLVGGAVRDQLLGLPVKDRDWVVVGATADEMRTLGYLQVGKDFPVFLHPETKEEYALARTERKTAKGYHGFETDSSTRITLEQDLQRRDLTINAMAQTLEGELIDPFGGQSDLTNGILRHVSPAFAEDPVRILRVARFAARYARWGFKVAHATNILMQSMVEQGEVDALVPERVWTETEKALCEQAPSRFFEVLHGCGALKILFPELEAVYAPNDKAHTEKSAPLAQFTLAAQQQTDPLLRFAFLFSWVLQNKEQVLALSERLRLPNDYRDLSALSVISLPLYSELTVLDTNAVVEFLYKTDAFRKPERFTQLLQVLAQRTKSENLFRQALHDLLQQALAVCRSVDSAALTTAGLQGPALGAAIKAARIEALRKTGFHARQ